MVSFLHLTEETNGAFFYLQTFALFVWGREGLSTGKSILIEFLGNKLMELKGEKLRMETVRKHLINYIIEWNYNRSVSGDLSMRVFTHRSNAEAGELHLKDI